jgi:dipeptidyl aminopeptidase/acylaminoacyl peptidase
VYEERIETLFAQAKAIYEDLYQPGTGQISDAAELNVSTDGRFATFAGTQMESLEGIPPTRVCVIELATAQMRVMTAGPGVDRSPKFSPDGLSIAFLSDRHKAGDFQLHVLDCADGTTTCASRVNGWVEYLSWSPDGTRILLGVAGHGADTASTHGAVVSLRDEDLPEWMPSVDTGQEPHRWRHAWIYEMAAHNVRRVTRHGINVWEAAWCGNGALLVSASAQPGEGAWYAARLLAITVDDGSSEVMYVPRDQLGCLAASPSGAHLAFVEAICSDRLLVAGELRIIERATGINRSIGTHDVDVTTLSWRSEHRLFIVGLRGFDTVVASYDVLTGVFEEVWKSPEVSLQGPAMSAAPRGHGRDCVVIGEGFDRAPQVALVCDGVYRVLASFDLGYEQHARCIASVERITWRAPDGLDIQGWLLRPGTPSPHSTVMVVHGGPVSNWRPVWLGRARTVPLLMLVQRGYAVFLPNPRGSSGRGQDFARRVRGDLGGADAGDLLAGIDHLVSRELSDVARLGVTGVSYGGFMTAWLVTHDTRFAAAVPVALAANRISQRLTCTHTRFLDLFLDDEYTNAHGRYVERSPIMYAHLARTPTLNICGALDRCTPATEALQFHNALRENGGTSELVTYPQEGHGIRKFPATADYAARMLAWFEEHMPPGELPRE